MWPNVRLGLIRGFFGWGNISAKWSPAGSIDRNTWLSDWFIVNRNSYKFEIYDFEIWNLEDWNSDWMYRQPIEKVQIEPLESRIFDPNLDYDIGYNNVNLHWTEISWYIKIWNNIQDYVVVCSQVKTCDRMSGLDWSFGFRLG